LGALHQLLGQSAARAPDHPLIAGPKGELSYAEVDRAAGALAAGLRARGVETGRCVALLLPDGPQFIVGYYGILKAGAVVVPLSPDARAESLCALLRRCRAAALITTGKNAKLLAGRLDALPELRLLVSVGPAQLEAEGSLRVAEWEETTRDGAYCAASADDDLASVMYTSGTTAQPKGVMLSHRNIVAATRSIVEYLALQPDERMAMVLPFFYSYGLSVLHTHICVGGTICLAGSVAFPAAVLRNIERFCCTGLSGVPSTFARLVHTKAIDKFDVGSLRYLTQAGGPMTPALTQTVLRTFPQARLYVMYGQTEAAPRLSYLPPAELGRKLGSVGRAIPGVTLHVVDAEGRPAAPGEVGELVATGPNIMVGYLDDPEETARVLRADGLHTGDLARVDEEGFIYLVGRQSDMIKAGAHRIGPQEIEQVIEKLPQVAECGVVGVPDELDGEAIAAYVLPAPGAEIGEQEVRKVCFDHLPRYKLPTHVRIVSEMPRTESGKLRRAGLREWFAAEGTAGAS
jgi:acyl-CoA synthetase (AMP-forming)/AMP-acid ligase II